MVSSVSQVAAYQDCSHPASVCLVDHVLHGYCPNVMTLVNQRRTVAFYTRGEWQARCYEERCVFPPWGQASPQLGPLTGPDPWGSTLPYRVYHTPKCASPKVLRASRRSGVLIIPKSAPLLNLEGWLIDATGYAPGLPSPMRPISVLAQNLGGIPSVLIQVLFSLPICLLQGGVAKSYEGMQNACLLCGQNTDLTTATAHQPR